MNENRQRGNFNPFVVLDSAFIAIGVIAVICLMAVVGAWEAVNATPRNAWAWLAWWVGVFLAFACGGLWLLLAWLRWGPT